LCHPMCTCYFLQDLGGSAGTLAGLIGWFG
jgi:hypothetical protein